eukprot:TRINITY_DN3421_c0_g1_i2.p1 TRINITY_DN3421_c0_g1~~TRINITY_DN3421_c0_g1_i2.p1  ORF type:complete len:519 (-),score=103.14 TRINITY_DN3421_c0_g1_i2:529-2085(-)
MEYNFQQFTTSSILCCLCGVQIQANPARMCVNCIRNQVDITEGIPKQLNVQYCRNCGRYHQPPTQWLICELESRELLALCLKRVKGLNKVKLIDAGFVWTEPHSKRLKVKLTVQKEVLNSTILQQSFIIEFIVMYMQCDQCARNYTAHTWKAVIQLRQKVEHKKTFYWLEQIILKHKMHSHTIKIEEATDGLDFYFSHRNQATRFLEFLEAVVPVRAKLSEELVSFDEQSSVANYKYTFSVEIVPICKDDLVCLPAKLAAAMGNISQICICLRVTTTIHLIDPLTLQIADLNAQSYSKSPFPVLVASKFLTEFVVLDIEETGLHRGKHSLIDVTVARVSDFGQNDRSYVVRSHLGYILNVGDYVFGYDVTNMNVNDEHYDAYRRKFQPQDIILVKKSYQSLKKGGRRRNWKLKTLEIETAPGQRKGQDRTEKPDFESFLQDLESDRDMRSNINLYKDPNYVPPITTEAVTQDVDVDADAEPAPEVGLEELLEDLNLDDDQANPDDDAGDQEEATMDDS